jgi:hypothetical protein
MTMTTNSTVVLVGGPDAGKTNYLGRLWMALDAETGVMAKNGLPPQVEYLRAIASCLNSGQFAQRTAPGVFESTSIPVRWGTGKPAGYLVVPDCAGEQWEKIHKERAWDSKWEQAVASMAGCILFFRGTSSHNVEPLNWSNHTEVMRCLEQVSEANAGPPKLPTQVVLVDWLQCLSTAHRAIHISEEPLPVSVVLSAWDEVPQESRNADPDDYLSRNLPLLHDFLAGNRHLFTPKSFGISVAGGVLSEEDTPFMKKFLKEDPNKTGYVVFTDAGKVVTSNDLTLPLAWAFGGECPEFGQQGIATP